MGKTALILGVTGQAGSYLCELLLKKGYTVHGLRRRSSSFNTGRIDHLIKDPHENPQLHLHYGDITDAAGLARIIGHCCPDEVYNLAAQSHVQLSFYTPVNTAELTGTGVFQVLEVLRGFKANATRYLQASSSEMFGKVAETPQSETTPFNPQSPYAIAKCMGYWATRNYREAYGMFASNAIIFNMESPRRGETFVTRKITMAAAGIAWGLKECMYLGNLDAKRDWGHARDYVRGMHAILEAPHPLDFVLATGHTISVREFLKMTFANLGMQIEFTGTGVSETAYVSDFYFKKIDLGAGVQMGLKVEKNQTVVRIDPRYLRPTEVDTLTGDATKARHVLGWKPEYGVGDIISEMILSDLNKLKP
jgi:GDPmannose 4,6-dehydratase